MSAVISTAAAIVSAAVSAAARRWRRCSTLRSGSTLRDRDVQLFTVEFVPIVKARSRLRGVQSLLGGRAVQVVHGSCQFDVCMRAVDLYVPMVHSNV